MPVYDHPSTPPTMECLFVEAERQQLSPALLLAVTHTERGRVGEFSKNRNGTYDIGPLQINKSWIDKLAKKTNSTPERVASQLAYDGCWNIAVGAWILRNAIDESPNDIWRGVGYYNSHNPKYWPGYAARVQVAYSKIINDANLVLQLASKNTSTSGAGAQQQTTTMPLKIALGPKSQVAQKPVATTIDYTKYIPAKTLESSKIQQVSSNN